MKVTSLSELTGHEWGVVHYYNDNALMVVNWSMVRGLPRDFYGATVGLGEPLVARRVPVPEWIKQWLHEAMPELEDGWKGYKGWDINGEAMVVVNKDWK